MLYKPARTCVDLVFYPGRDASSFGAVWNELERLATDVEGMPASCRPAKGLRTQLEEVAMHVMRDVQDRCEAMLATPANYATRVTIFIVDG